MGSSREIVFAFLHLCAHKLRRFHSGSRGFTRAHLKGRVHSGLRGFTRARHGVVGFIRVRVGSHVRSYRTPVSYAFVKVNSGAYSFFGVHPFLRGWAWDCRVHWGLRGFTKSLLKVAGFIGFRVGSFACS